MQQDDSSHAFQFGGVQLTLPTPTLSKVSSTMPGYYRMNTQSRIMHSRETQLTHLCRLDIDNLPIYPRVTSIMCTLGPSCETPEMIRRMIVRGMNIARINLTLGSYKYCSQLIKAVRAEEAKLNSESMDSYMVAVAVDITAPTLRTGQVGGAVNGSFKVSEGEFVTITVDEAYKDDCTAEHLYIDTAYWRKSFHAINVGDRIDIDDGTVMLIAREKASLTGSIRCLVEQGGILLSSRVVRLPRMAEYRHAVAEKYKQDLLFAVENQVDIVCCGFAESGLAITQIRKVLGPFSLNTKVLARIESSDGLKNPEIRHCARQCGQKACSVSDVANAVLDGADVLALGVETAKGAFPLETLQVMVQVCQEAESAYYHGRKFVDLKRIEAVRLAAMGPNDEQIETFTSATAAVSAAMTNGAAAIIVVTTTGKTAFAVASYRPPCPILTVTRQMSVARQCHLYRGLRPVYFSEEKCDDWSEDMDRRITHTLQFAVRSKFVKPGERVVICTGWHAGQTNTVRLVVVPAEEFMSSPLHIVRSSQVFNVSSKQQQPREVAPNQPNLLPPNQPAPAWGENPTVTFD
uniref:pyruvate kinase n=1 Tax=Macrostomum lignano TaxID=282301 RepID=A0A1I8FW52_9PLAT